MKDRSKKDDGGRGAGFRTNLTHEARAIYMVHHGTATLTASPVWTSLTRLRRNGE